MYYISLRLHRTAFCRTFSCLTRQKLKSILVVLLLTSGSTPFVMSQMPLMRHLQPGVRPTLRDSHADVLFLSSSKCAGGQQSIRSSRKLKKKIYMYILLFYTSIFFPSRASPNLRHILWDESARAAVYRAHGQLDGDQGKNLSISSLLATFLSLFIAQWSKAVLLSCDPCRVTAWH